MRLNAASGIVAIAMLACGVSACSQQRSLSPLSPSALSSRPADAASPTRVAALAPRRVDYHDGETPPPANPMPDPGADPGTTPPPPNPDQPLPPDGVPVPVPVQLTISIIGSFGNLAFAPNPQQAAVGNTVVWANNDLVQHTIVLDDGTPVGTLAPGQSSAPITLIAETTGYHCTLHASMVGQIVPIPVLPPDGVVVPPDGVVIPPGQTPVPPSGPAPGPAPAPPDSGDGYDGYDYDYLESGK
jgi:hypothetical protein